MAKQKEKPKPESGCTHEWHQHMTRTDKNAGKRWIWKQCKKCREMIMTEESLKKEAKTQSVSTTDIVHGDEDENAVTADTTDATKTDE